MSLRFLPVISLNVAAMWSPNSASSSFFTSLSIPRVLSLMAVERIRSWVHLDVYLEGLAETELLGGETKGESIR